LLVSCDPTSVGAVMDVFARMGFAQAAEIGEVVASGPVGAQLLVD